MHESVKKLMNGLVISCQAYEDTPLYGSENMKRMAQCAVMGGASGIRGCWPQDIRAIRSVCDLPIVGINKKFGDGDPLEEIFITPTYESAVEIIEAGADIIALDCTIRKSRSFDELYKLLERIKKDYPNIAIMADLATEEEALKVAETGFIDIISTTLSGYTSESINQKSDGPNIEMIKSLKKKINLPINGEGRIWEIKDMQDMLDAGADIVTIGTAVTRPHLITERFVNFNNKYHQK
ncbi:MAG: N-acetylmannosamine-6-phosphate 2-epimerase [Erysipelotrichaceae bacterium]